MSSEKLGHNNNVLKGDLGGGFDILTGSTGEQTDLGVARRFGGAAAAYSLRDIGAMNGRVVRVRRDTGGGAGDNDEEDFSASQVASGALESFVGAGNNGFITLWYDQSGNDHDAYQSSASSQPKIVNNGTIELSPSNQPALRFISPTKLSVPVNGHIDNLNSVSFFVVGEYETASIPPQYFLNLTNFSQIPQAVGVGSSPSYSGYTNFSYGSFGNQSTSHTPSVNQNILYSAVTDSSDFEGFADGSSILTTSVIDRAVTQDGSIGAWATGTYHLNGTISEVIIFDAGKADDRADIEENIADYYNITLS